MTPREYERLQKEAALRKQEADQAQGRLQQLLKTLKKDFGVSDLKQGEKLLKKLQAEEAQAEKEFAEAKEAFEEQYGELL